MTGAPVGRAEQTVRVVQEAQIAAQRDDRTGRRGRDTEHGRDEAVDPVRTAVRVHRQTVARGHAPLERAHGQARRDDERGAVRERGGQVAREHAFICGTGVCRAGTVQHAVDRGARAALGVHPRVEPHALGLPSLADRRRERVEERPGRGNHSLGRGPMWIEPGVVGIDDDLFDVGVEPRVENLARDGRADADDEVGTMRRRERFGAQQRFVG